MVKHSIRNLIKNKISIALDNELELIEIIAHDKTRAVVRYSCGMLDFMYLKYHLLNIGNMDSKLLKITHKFVPSSSYYYSPTTIHNERGDPELVSSDEKDIYRVLHGRTELFTSNNRKKAEQAMIRLKGIICSSKRKIKI